MTLARAEVLVALLALANCRRSPPPILFGHDADQAVTTAGDAGTGAADPGAARGDAGAAYPVAVSTPVGGDGATVMVDGVSVMAAPGERFVQYLALDVDNDGDRDLVVARGGQNGTALGVGFYRREPAGFTPVGLEGAAPSDPRCAAVTLRAASPRSVVVTYVCPVVTTGGESADAGMGPPVAEEHLVVALDATPPVVRLRVANQLPALANTALTTEVTAVDRDGDGHDDAVVVVGARRPSDRPETTAHATVVLLARGGSYARDTAEPEASFARLAATARGLATRRHAPEAVAMVERILRLRRGLCAESGVARVRLGEETGVACAGSSGLRAVGEALARAYIVEGEYPAAAALTRPETAGELGVVSGLAADLRRALPTERGLEARPGPFVGLALQTAVFLRASALELQPSREPTGVLVRGEVPTLVDLATLTVPTAGDAGTAGGTGGTGGTGGSTDATNLLVRSLDGTRALQGFYETCSGVVAALCPADAGDCMTGPRPDEVPPSATVVRITDQSSVEHAAACLREATAVTALRGADPRAVGYGREGLVVAFQGRLYRLVPGASAATVLGPGDPLGGPFPPGSSASETGQYAVVAGPDGLFVRDGTGRWRGWMPASLAGRYRQLTDATISDDGRVVAALLGSQLWVVDHAAPPGAPPSASGAGP